MLRPLLLLQRTLEIDGEDSTFIPHPIKAELNKYQQMNLIIVWHQLKNQGEEEGVAKNKTLWDIVEWIWSVSSNKLCSEW